MEHRAGRSGESPLIARARAHAERTAILAGGRRYAYRELLAASGRVAGGLLAGRKDLGEGRVAFLAPSGFAWAATLWGIWRAGGIAVPLSSLHPPRELRYLVEDADCELLVADRELEERLASLVRGRRLLGSEELLAAPEAVPASLPEIPAGRGAMLLYTSGTTSRPKGVVFTHRTIQAQIEILVEAWGWRADDRILLVLPLHHVHGIINVLSCALWSGAGCEMMARFDPRTVWRRLASRELTLFMAVPTVYARLLAAWEEASPGERRRWSEGVATLRLMVSGSAALPVSLFEGWRRVTGHPLLERYGMTEIGMALSNPLRGERRPGHVGQPLPGVEIRLVDEEGRIVAEGEPGEIEVRGPGVFPGYWRRPEATRLAFRDGWFRTGDVAVEEGGSHRILGRSSVDIIKSGGYKISALEVEEVLREHPAIAECAVVGVADAEWGERVAAAVVLESGRRVDLEGLREWAKERLAPYKIPTRLLTLDRLPRNPLGKVTKPALAARFRTA